MQKISLQGYTAFHGQQRIASGELANVAQSAKEVIDRVEHASILIFDNATSRQVEIDFRGTADEVLQRLPPLLTEPVAQSTEVEEPRVGRPKLGVIAREVTLLPRHWEWLATQPASASVTLRKLVEDARRNSVAHDRERLAQEATNRFMMIMAGNFPGFEEASRALYRKDKAKFEQSIADWPVDIRDHVNQLAADAGWEA
ncbi:hypothetical protein IAD21_06287 [Abditibacteriota bacterium]|nr:hypothetical protein IAD21_06287 [Abditibacteriota bacterium]